MDSRSIHLLPLQSPVDADVAVPGSKSDTNRALVLAAQANGVSRITGASRCEDSVYLIAALRRLGVDIAEERGGETLLVHGALSEGVARAGDSAANQLDLGLDLGLAGTSFRFLAALCAATPGVRATLTGNARMRERPVGDLVDALRALGADVRYVDGEGTPPIAIEGRRLSSAGRTIDVSGETSSQFASALLLASPSIDGGLRLRVRGAFRSRPYVDMTVRAMRAFGSVPDVADDECTFDASAASLRAVDYAVEGDASGASYLWGVAALCGGRVRVSNLPRESVQGDLRFPRLLQRMGCRVVAEDDAVTVFGGEALRGVEVDLASMPDVAPTLAVVAACADGVTRLSGLETLALKESDRLAAVRDGLRVVGVECAVDGGDIVVTGAGGRADATGCEGIREGTRASVVDPRGDHRIAMAFGMLGARIGGVRILDPGVVAKSFPGFWDALGEMGVRSEIVESR